MLFDSALSEQRAYESAFLATLVVAFYSGLRFSFPFSVDAVY